MRLIISVVFLLLAGQAQAATLLGQYRLEDLQWTGAAGEVADSSGNNRHGQAIGSPLASPVLVVPARPGVPGTCAYGSFPGPVGNGGALSISGLPVSLAAGAKTSVSFWMYWDGTENAMPIGWNRHDLWLVSGYFGFNTGNSDVFGISSAGLANGWHHVTAIFTNNNVAANALYIDGVAQVLTQLRSSPSNPNAVVNSTLRIGGWQTDTNYRFSGRIDEVKVYDGQLTPAEITAVYNETHTCAPRLILDWQLDECSLGSVVGEVLDASGSGNHGTPQGTANTVSGRVCKGGVFNGASPTRIEPTSNFADTIANDFTIAFWANPSVTHQIDAQATTGTGGVSGQRYALYPAQGTTTWGAGHAGAGISVGTNGVSVYEHAASYMPALLSWTGAVSGWTHVAVVYQARQPRLYINGSLVATGLTSTYANVHPGLRGTGDPSDNDGGAGGGRWGWYSGGLDEFRIYDGALNAGQVAAIAVPAGRSCASCATLAHYRLEEALWAGVAGEVKDSSGNNRHGQALTSPLPVPATAAPARAGNPGTCGYGGFVGGALNLPVAANTAAGAKTTVSFWMYWNGINSVMPIGWFRHDLWLTGGNFGFNTASSDVFGISTAGLANRWVHVSAVFTNGSVTSNKLYIDGVSQPLTQRQGSPSAANAVVNANLRVSGWQSDGGYRFRTSIDEVNVFDGEMTQSQVLAQFNATHPCGGAPDHIELVHDGAALTCTPKAVTVLACTTAASCVGVPANQYAAGTFQIALNPIAGATWCADAQCATPLPNPATVSNGAIVYLRDPSVRTDRMVGTSSSAANTTIQCSNTATAAAMNATTECDVAYADAGFIFNVSDHKAETAQNITVSAVKKSDSSPACVPAFAGVSKPVNFKCAYVNPASGTLPVRANGVALNAGNNASSACDAAGRDVSLAFDASGVAPMTVNYADVGKMALSARYAPTGGTDAGLVMTGTDDFIAAPTDFSVTTIGPFVAGTQFNATVTARNAAGTATPNFGQEGETVTLALGSRIEPAGANACPNAPCDGAVAGGVTAPWSGGATTATNVTYSEVGTMTLRATLASGDYLSAGLTPAAIGTSATTGPFVPAYFETAVTQGCVAGAFTYSAQPFKVDVTAKNAAGATTVNYSSLPPCAACSRDVTLQDPLLTANFNSTNTVLATTFTNGVGSRADVAYTLPTPTTAPTAITLRAIDALATPSVSSLGHAEGLASVRSGRMRLSNANGSELLDLPLPLTIQYWAGPATGWTTHASDSCTPIQPANFALVFGGAGNNLVACETAVTVAGTPPNYTVTLLRPGAGNAGWTDLTLNLAAAAGNTCTAIGGPGPTATSANLPWLRFDWKGAGPANPTARATFGIVKSGPVIHRREMY
ncbi:MAG: LamG domain-containing protein [Gammaproteobacteria bacterium]|nr:LamG domain-containing protein [Gammaproteobacteria bacterium]MBU1645904.1 LamG domain-containing protein [Gammaproteobacteria bacterium]MBU1971966.1 LamG domain-containing protein [Gammaproteobacteria bacterium]